MPGKTMPPESRRAQTGHSNDHAVREVQTADLSRVGVVELHGVDEACAAFTTATDRPGDTVVVVGDCEGFLGVRESSNVHIVEDLDTAITMLHAELAERIRVREDGGTCGDRDVWLFARADSQRARARALFTESGACGIYAVLVDDVDEPRQSVRMTEVISKIDQTQVGPRKAMVSVMGPVRISCDDHVYEGPMRQIARELAAYLAWHERPGGARAISEALWPYATRRSHTGTPSQIKDARYHLKAALRSVCGDDREYLSRRRNDQGFLTEEVDVDIRLFRQAMDEARIADCDADRLGALERAAAFWRGDYAEDCDGFTEIRARVRAMMVEALSQIAELRDGAPAVAAARRALDIDDTSERAWLALISTQARLGYATDVRQTYRDYVARMTELGRDICEDIRHVAEHVQAPGIVAE
jgi:DNA-binding SARP family transcriptional activator